jgi:hypothetical protein
MLVLLPGLDGTGHLFGPVVDALGPNVPTQIARYPLSHASGYATCEAIARGALPTDRPYTLLGESFSGPVAATAPPGLRGLLLTAKHDHLIPNAAAHLIRHQAPAATIVEIDAPHFLLQCRPPDAADAIRMFPQQFDPGHGDYTVDRDCIVRNPTVDDLMDELEHRRQSPPGK